MSGLLDRTIVCQKRRYKGVAVFAKEGSDNNGGTETFSDGLIIFQGLSRKVCKYFFNTC